jgi:hypothetical protein
MWGKILFATNEMSLLTTELLYFLLQVTSAFQATQGEFDHHIIHNLNTKNLKEYCYNWWLHLLEALVPSY